jgi:hypothetical protein
MIQNSPLRQNYLFAFNTDGVFSTFLLAGGQQVTQIKVARTANLELQNGRFN